MTNDINFAATLATPEVDDMVKQLVALKVWKEIQDLGGDPTDVIARNIGITMKMHTSPKLRLSYLTNALTREKKILSAKDNRGIVVGTVDDATSSPKAPMNVVMLTSDDELKTYAIFKQSLVQDNGIYTFDANCNDDGKLSVRAVLGREKFNQNPALYFMESSNVMTTDDERWNTIQSNEYPAVLIRGTIKAIRANPVFGKDDSGANAIIGFEPVYQLNQAEPEPKMHPTITMQMDNNGGTYNINVAFRRCRHGMPYFGVPDVDTVFALATENSADPDTQISVVAHMFEGREYLILGRLTNMRERTDRNGEVTTSVNVRGIACFSIEDIPYLDYEHEAATEHPAQAVSPEPIMETVSIAAPDTISDASTAEAAEASETKAKKTTKKAAAKDDKEDLVVEAPVVEKPVEVPADAASVTGERYPNYAISSSVLVANIVEDVLKIVQILKTPANTITKYYIESTLTLGDRPDIPEAAWDIILNKIRENVE